MKFNSKAAINKAKVEVLEKCYRSFRNTAWDRLMEKHKAGHYGWDDPDWDEAEIRSRLEKAFKEQKWLDVANFAMFLWNREDKKDVPAKTFK